MQFEVRARVVSVREFVWKARALGHQIIACSCGEEHLHALAELPPEHADVKREVGKCKQKVSHALRDVLPGSVWSEGGEYKLVKDAGHFANAYNYIRTRQESGTVVWSHNPAENWIDDSSGSFLVVSEARSIERACIDDLAHPGLR